MPNRSQSLLIAVLADTFARAQSLASALAEDSRIDILFATTHFNFVEILNETVPDVAVAVALSQPQIPSLPCPVVVISDSSSPSFDLYNGVHAWLPLNASLEELSAAIFAAALDLTVLTSRQIRQWTKNNAVDADDELTLPLETLTPRELQVLRMLADGLGNKQIAGQLGLSNHTAKFHVAQILAKLGATSRTEAVTIGIRRGLVPI